MKKHELWLASTPLSSHGWSLTYRKITKIERRNLRPCVVNGVPRAIIANNSWRQIYHSVVQPQNGPRPPAYCKKTALKAANVRHGFGATSTTAVVRGENENVGLRLYAVTLVWSRSLIIASDFYATIALRCLGANKNATLWRFPRGNSNAVKL